MWIASKALWLVIQPLSWLVITGLLAAVFAFWGKRRLAGLFALFTPLFLVVISFSPLPIWAVHTLERQHSAPSQIPPEVAGVIVLGGTTQLFDENAIVPPMTAASERFLTGLVLAKALPDDRPLIFTGASRSFERFYKPEAQRLADLSRALGYEGALVIEPLATNTCEHAPEIAKLIGSEAAGQRWIIVTSAFHMARSVRCFQAAGWNDVIAYPTDYNSDPVAPYSTNMSLIRRLNVFNWAIREHVGTLLYRLVGRID